MILFTTELEIKGLKLILSIIIIVLLFTVFIYNSEIIAVDDDLVVLQDVEGEVYHRSQGFWFFSNSWQQAETGMILQEGDQLKTEAGQCEVVFMSGARVLVEEDSKLELLKNYSESELQLVELESGQIVIDIFETLRDSFRFEIETPSAIAGVRGTRFSVEVVDEYETTVMVREGEVEVANQVMDKEVMANQKVIVKADDQKFEAVPFTAEDEEIWQKRDQVLEEKKDQIEEIEEKIEEQIKEKIDKPNGENKGADKSEVDPSKEGENGNSEQAEDKKPDEPADEDESQKPDNPGR